MLLAFNHHSLIDALDLVFVLVCDVYDTLKLSADELTDQVLQDHAINGHRVRPDIPEKVLDRSNVLSVLGVRGVRLDWDSTLRDLVIKMLLVLF